MVVQIAPLLSIAVSFAVYVPRFSYICSIEKGGSPDPEYSDISSSLVSNFHEDIEKFFLGDDERVSVAEKDSPLIFAIGRRERDIFHDDRIQLYFKAFKSARVAESTFSVGTSYCYSK